jgi:hypothetical protein
MLDLCYERELIDTAWEATSTKTRLPAAELEFFNSKGPLPISPENKRTFHRFYLRGKALLKRRDTFLGVYTKDVSRRGIGFLSPVQLLPKEQVNLRMPGTKELMLEVTRCRRVDHGCYDAGAKFILNQVQD